MRATRPYLYGSISAIDGLKGKRKIVALHWYNRRRNRTRNSWGMGRQSSASHEWWQFSSRTTPAFADVLVFRRFPFAHCDGFLVPSLRCKFALQRVWDDWESLEWLKLYLERGAPPLWNFVGAETQWLRQAKSFPESFRSSNLNAQHQSYHKNTIAHSRSCENFIICADM